MEAESIRSRSVVVRVALFVAVSIALIGCGGAESSSDGVRSVVEQYYAARESGNGAEACSLLTNEAREEIVRPLLVYQARLRRRFDCARLMTLYARAVLREPVGLRELTSTIIGPATVTGNQATVVVTQPHEGPHDVPLVKTADAWRISKQIARVAVPPKPIGG